MKFHDCQMLKGELEMLVQLRRLSSLSCHEFHKISLEFYECAHRVSL
jgi:hypothetical protein